MTSFRGAVLRQAPALCALIGMTLGGVSTCAQTPAQTPPMTASTSASVSVFREDQTPPAQSLERAGSISSHAALDRGSEGLTGTAWANALGLVGYGHMQLRTSGATTIDGGGRVGEAIASAQARASLYDSFLIRCPSCVAGTEATVTFRVIAETATPADGRLSTVPDDRLSAAFTAYSEVSSSFSMNAPNAEDPSQPAGTSLYQSALRWQSGGDYHDRPRWDEFITARFILGDPLSFSWNAILQGESRAGNYTDIGSMSASSGFYTEFTSSFYWGGISEVRDSNGQLLTGITAFNAAGINYADALPPSPVPEPATLWLMLCGTAGVLMLARRAGHRPASRPAQRPAHCPGQAASVGTSGSRIAKQLPPPSRPSQRTVPLWASAICLTRFSPNPTPPDTSAWPGMR